MCQWSAKIALFEVGSEGGLQGAAVAGPSAVHLVNVHKKRRWWDCAEAWLGEMPVARNAIGLKNEICGEELADHTVDNQWQQPGLRSQPGLR
jgi:hypothetical protein